MLEDLIKGVRDYISDRFMSPLGAALATSWCAWNYKFIIIVFSGESPLRKIHLIHLVYSEAWFAWTHLLVGPILTSALYIFAFPYPSRLVYKFTLMRRKESLALLREIEGQTPLTQQESQALRDRFTQIETDHLAEKLKLSNSLDSVKEQLRSALEGKQAAEQELLRLQDARILPADKAGEQEIGTPAAEETNRASRLKHLSVTHRDLMRTLSSQSSPSSAAILSNSLNKSPEVVGVVLNDLLSDGLIEEVPVRTGSGARVTGFRLTPAGVRALLAL